MAPKLSPAKLREQAQQLIKHAEEQELLRQQLIGKIVTDAMENDFDGFDLSIFKTQATQLWADGKLKKTRRKPTPKEQASTKVGHNE